MILKHIINVGIYGQYIESSGGRNTGFIYKLSSQGTDSCEHVWTKFFEPRLARDFNSNEIFALWSNEEGTFYGVVIPTNDYGDGRILLAINIKKAIVSDGQTVVDTLRQLRDYYINSNGNLDNGKIEEMLTFLDNSLIQSGNISYEHTTSAHNISGYRVYSTREELAIILTYPHQQEYSSYECIFVTPIDLTMPNPYLKKILAEIKIVYQIVSVPSDVELQPSRHSVQKGGTLTIIYKKAGCKDEKRTVKVQGTSSFEPAITYLGNSIRINDAKTLGIKFMRIIYLDFFEEGTNSRVRNVTIVNERNQKQVSDYILLPESDNSASFRIEATGYEKRLVQLSPAEISSGRAKVELKPKISQRDITVILPDGRSSQIRAKIKDGDPLSSYLDRNMGRLVVSRKSFGGSTPPPYYGGGEGRKKQSWWKRIPIWIWSVVAMLVSYLVCAWFFNIWPFNGKEEAQASDETTTEQFADTSQTDSIAAANKQADLDYMKSSANDDCWDKAQLKTDDLKNLIDFIANGQVDNAINHNYKDGGKDNVNGYWSGIVKIVNEIKGRVPDDEIADAFRRCKVDYSHEKVSVKKLNNELASLKKRLDTQSSTTSNGQTSQTNQSSQNRQGTNSQNNNRSSANVNRSNSNNAGATTGSQSNNNGRERGRD